MKKITLKFMLFAAVVVSLQSQAQTEGTKYTLQNAQTGQYLQANGSGQYIFADAVAEGDNSFNFTFWHHNTIDPGADAEVGTADDVAHNYTDDWNIQGDVRGIMRAANTGTVHTNFKYNAWNSNGGHKTDKRWIATSTDVGGGVIAYRFQAAASGDEPRYLFQGTNGVLYNFTDADAGSDATSVSIDGVDTVVSDGEILRTYWVLAEAVLSTDNFDASSLTISNPVNDRLIVRGINSDITKLSVYNLLGSKVLTKNLTGDSSVELSVSNLVSGMYIVKLEGANKAFSKKIIKQ